MTATQVPAIVLTIGLSTLSVTAFAQTTGKSDAAPTAGSAATTSSTGQVSDPGWTSATEATPSAVTPVPSAAPNTAPATPAPAQVAPTAPDQFQNKSSTNVPAPEEPASPADEPVTLFGQRHVKLGGYGAIGARYTRLHGEDSAIGGVEGAFLIDHRLAVGFAAYGSSNEHRLNATQGFDRPYMHFGYGGFLLRYHVFIPQSPVSISVATLVGGGAVGVTNQWDDDVHRDNADMFFVFEPQLGAHINVTRWMRFGIDAGYRFVSGIGRFGLSESDFRGASVGGSVGFGWF